MFPVDNEAPNWAWGPDQDVHCPECQEITRGLNYTGAAGDEEAPTTMTLVPCGHVLPMDQWTITPTGHHGQLELKRSE